FHHFKSKEELAIEAARHWGAATSGLFASAPYRALPDPLDRVLAYVDFRKAILQGELPEYTCFAGTTIQEVYDTHPLIREACEKTITDHAAFVEADIAEAMHKYHIIGDWTAQSLAFYTQAVIQGAFILAKAQQNSAVAADCIDHLRRSPGYPPTTAISTTISTSRSPRSKSQRAQPSTIFSKVTQEWKISRATAFSSKTIQARSSTPIPLSAEAASNSWAPTIIST